MEEQEDFNSCQKDKEATVLLRTTATSSGGKRTPGVIGEMKPPDGGWGWLVTFGGFINTAMSPMIGTCFAIIFSRFLLDLKTSSTTVAWIYNLQSSIFNIVGLMAEPLIREFGWRKVTFLGALCTSLSLISSAFATSAEFLYFSFAILAGIGSGATVCSSMLIVPRYFDKRRGRANSILMAGFCIGQMFGPPLSRYLHGEYGFVGGTLLVGAILLHGCVAACLFHPLEWHMKEVDVKLSDVPESLIAKGDDGDEGIETSPRENENCNDDCKLKMLHKTCKNDHRRKSSHASLSSMGNSTSDIMHLPTTSVQKEEEEKEEKGNIVRKTKIRNICAIFSIFVRVMRITIKHLRILRSPAAVIVALGNTFLINGYINFLMMVPFAMQAGGHSLDSAAWCISVSAICNLLSRILANSLTDFSWFNIKIFYIIGLAMVAICIFVFPLQHELHWLMVTMGFWGCGVGATMGVYSLIMIEVMGSENMAACFGATCLLIAIGYITLGPLMGYMRDVSSSYAVSMWISASLVTISFILWLFMPVALAYDRRKAEEGEEEVEEEEEKENNK